MIEEFWERFNSIQAQYELTGHHFVLRKDTRYSNETTDTYSLEVDQYLGADRVEIYEFDIDTINISIGVEQYLYNPDNDQSTWLKISIDTFFEELGKILEGWLNW